MNKGVVMGAVVVSLTIVAYIDDPTIFNLDSEETSVQDNGEMMADQNNMGSSRQGLSQRVATQQVDRTRRPQPVRGEMPDGAIRVQQVDIIDRNGFGRPVVAVKILIPVGWKTQGGRKWSNNISGCGKTTPHTDWSATAPDGIGKITVFPEEAWSGLSSNAGMQMPQTRCPNITNTDTKQFVFDYVRRHRPDARILDYRDRSDIVKVLQEAIKNMPAANYTGVDQRQWVGAGHALIGYQVNGVEVRELVAAGAMFIRTNMQGVYPGEIRTMVNILTLPGFAVRMREGRLDLKKAEMFRKSSWSNPEYNALMAAHNARIAAINMKGIIDRGKIRRKYSREVNSIINGGWAKRQAIQSRGQRERIEAIRGVETYNSADAPGGTIQLDNTYKNAWRLDDGTYVLSNSPSFKPYAATGIDGKLLQRTR